MSSQHFCRTPLYSVVSTGVQELETPQPLYIKNYGGHREDDRYLSTSVSVDEVAKEGWESSFFH